MAEGGTAKPKHLNLSCGCCGQTVHAPVSRDCQHIYCVDCLTNNAKLAGNCKFCSALLNENKPIAENKFEALQKVLQEDKPLTCQICELEKNFSFLCRDCVMYMCSRCKRMHDKMPETVNHSFINTGGLEAESSAKTEAKYSSLYEQTKKVCSGDGLSGIQRMDQLEQLSKTIDQEIEARTGRYSKWKEESDKQLNMLINRLRAQKVQVNEELCNDENSAIEALQKRKQKLQNQAESMRAVLNMAQLTKERTRNTSQLMALQSGLLDRAKELSKEEVTVEPVQYTMPSLDTYDFTDEDVHNMLVSVTTVEYEEKK